MSLTRNQYFNVKSGGVTPSGIAYNRRMITGQVTSYRTGDDAWAVINMPPPANPTNPIYWAELSNFTTLVNNNVFGNTNRFTDENGLQVYGNNVIIDHYTGLMWFTGRDFTDWNTQIDNALAMTDPLGNNDYFMPNNQQAVSIFNAQNAGFNYAPFNTFWAFSNTFYSTSTTDVLTTGNAYKIRRQDTGMSTLKSNGALGIRCRWHY